jgi:predicted dehydrogenase
MSIKKRYAVVGMGARARAYTDPICTTFRDRSDLVAICDPSTTRMEWHNKRIREVYEHPEVSTYIADDFDKMIVEQKPDVVIVTTPDFLHHEYIVRAMDAGCDVIVEKPMTIDAAKSRAIHEAIQRTGRTLKVAFNYRYQPIATKIRELMMQGVVGTPLSVTYAYMLDTRHGADYFRRWHRDKANSGGLLVHKATHHFDLVNWFLDSYPEEVFAFGDLKFYGREAAESRGEKYDYERYTGAEGLEQDPFAMPMDNNEYLRTLYLNAENEGGYIRDKNVFGSGVTTEDTMAVTARFANGVIFSYSLIAYAPQEGYEMYITGTKGRIEWRHYNVPHMLDENLERVTEPAEESSASSSLRVLPMFGKPYEVEVPTVEGGHGGGDTILAEHLFSNEEINDPFHRYASYTDGVKSLAMGISANESIATGKPVKIRDMVTID